MMLPKAGVSRSASGCRRPGRWNSPLLFGLVVGVALTILWLSEARQFQSTSELPFHPAAVAQEQPAEATVAKRIGFLVQVPLPIRGDVDTLVKDRIDRVLKAVKEKKTPVGGSRPILVLEFLSRSEREGVLDPEPGQAPAAEDYSDFGRSLALARYLTSEAVGSAQICAFLPDSVKGHAVLPVLACEQIIMSKDAQLGPANIPADSVDDAVLENYAAITRRRRTIPEAVARGLADDRLGVFQISTPPPGGIRFETQAGREQLQKEGQIVSERSIFAVGEPHFLTGAKMREIGFSAYQATNRREVAEALQIADNALREHLAPDGRWRPNLVHIHGPINRRMVNWLIRRIEDGSRRDEFDLLILDIDSGGGAPEESLRLAQRIADLEAKIHTVAVVERQALGDAALIAWAADELLVSAGAKLGGDGETTVTNDLMDAVRDPVRRLGERLERDWSLPLALLDPRVSVAPYNRVNGDLRFLCQEELASIKDRDEWQRSGDALELRDGLRGEKAVQIGFAQGLIQGLDGVKSRFQIDDLRPLHPNWAIEFVEWLANPRIAGILLFIGWFALMIELSTPGVSAPGLVAAICFGLFFWSQFLHGTAGWLEILLFVGGAICIALEVLVLPGIGIFGLAGGVMLILSIVLASQTFIVPGNSYQMRQLPISILMVIAGGAGAIVSIAVIRRFLPHTPYFNRMLLEPPTDAELQEARQRESLVSWEHLRGKRGVTTTQLTPSGKARFGDDIVDVLGDGELIPKGQAVYVAEVFGNRVLVRTIEN